MLIRSERKREKDVDTKGEKEREGCIYEGREREGERDVDTKGEKEGEGC